MRFPLLFSFLIGAIVLGGSLVHAQVDTTDFNIRVFGYSDVLPPTTPTLVSATPVAASQINLSWTVATDNFAVAGYVITRGTSTIATTTLTTFSDSGLSASTTYSYSIRAFDAAFNYSSSSNSLSTTTLQAPVPPVVATTTSSGAQSTAVGAALDTAVVTPGLRDAEFYVVTKRPAQIEIRWGRDSNYDSGYIANERFTTDYKTTITDLEPGTVYEYEIIGYSPRGIRTVLKRGQFTTLNTTAGVVGNVSKFTAQVDNRDVRLDWIVPDTSTFSYVRVVRNHLYFPSSPNDGAIIYQGDNQSFVDANILNNFTTVYYTIFVYDEFGNISSGAVAKASSVRSADGTVEIINEGIEIIEPAATTTDVVIDTSTTTQGSFRIPALTEIFILQTGDAQTFASDLVRLKKDTDYTISVPFGVVAKNLKTILLTLTNPADPTEEYSYILRINKDKTAYEAKINPLYVSGESIFTLAIYDYETKIVSRYTKKVFFGDDMSTAGKIVWFPDFFFAHKEFVLGGMIGLLLLLLLLVLKRSEDKVGGSS